MGSVGKIRRRTHLPMNSILDLISALSNAVIDLLRKILEKLTQIEYALGQMVRLLAKVVEQPAASLTDAPAKLPEPAPDEQELDQLYDAKYAAERIGVVERTVYRLTEKGMLPVHAYHRGQRRFLHSDIERCRREYRGG